MTVREGLAVAYAHAQLVQAMQFERFADHSKVPEHIQMLEYMLGEYSVALEHYVSAFEMPTEDTLQSE